VQYA